MFLPWQDGAYGVCLSICTDTGEKHTWFLNHPESTQTIRECVDEIQAWFDKADVVIAHNAKFDLHWNQNYGIELKGSVHCTLLAEYVLQGHAVKMIDLGLSTLSVQRGFPPKSDKVKEYWDAGYQTDEIPASVLVEYAELDAELALKVYLQQAAEIKERDLTTLISLDMETLLCIQEMEWNGMLLDKPLLEEWAEETTRELVQLDAWLVDTLGIHNAGSNEQLSCGLFGGSYQIAGRVPGKREGTMKNGKVPHSILDNGAGFTPDPNTRTKKDGIYSVSVDLIELLKPRTPMQREIKEKLIERSRKDQLNKVYFKGLSSRADDTGYVHCNLNQVITKTSRLSCSNPNLQNIPRGDTGPVKKCFLSRW